MPTFRPSARHLYLLALFQLVGGPLVILSVVFFSRLVAKYSADDGVVVGVTQAWQSPEWQKITRALIATTPGPIKASPEGHAEKVKEPGGKVFWQIWTEVDARWSQRPPEAAPSVPLPTLLSAWPDAPPLPPPRCACA